jgi:hypothetical protein
MDLEIDEIVAKAIPIPRSCATKIQRAQWDREQLKERIIALLEKYSNFTKTIKDEDRNVGTEKD